MKTDIDRLPTANPEELLQISDEIELAFKKLKNVQRAVAIYGSARTKEGHAHYVQAYNIAKLLGENDYAIITGGGPGIMQAANQGARAGKALSIGLHICLPNEQFDNDFLDINVHFQHFFTRKLAFSTFSMAYVIMAGGAGTLDEVTEALVLMQTGKLKKRPIIFYGKDFWSGFLDWIKSTIIAAGYIVEEEIKNIYLVESPEEVLEIIQKFEEETCACK